VTKSRVVVVVAVAVLLTGACGGGGEDKSPASEDAAATTTVPASSSKGSVEPCTLLTQAELQEAFGSPFDAGEAKTLDPPIGGHQCTWTNTDSPPVKTFSATIRTDADLADALRSAGRTVKVQFSDTQSMSRGLKDFEALSGLGDQAFRSGTRLELLKGNVELSFTTLFGDSPEALAGLKSLAAKAAARVN
jgi:hypothetical protein